MLAGLDFKLVLISGAGISSESSKIYSVDVGYSKIKIILRKDWKIECGSI